MTREEHLTFCQICTNQKFDLSRGIVCGLTDAIADFDPTCDFFNEDTEKKAQIEATLAENEILSEQASQGKRLANYLLDFIFYLIFSFVFGIFLGILSLLGMPELLSTLEEGNKFIEYGLGFLLSIFYYTSLEYTSGKTIAKYITGTKVVNLDGSKPTFGTILIRSLCRFIPFEPFSFLFSGNSGWHDQISKTKVINAK